MSAAFVSRDHVRPGFEVIIADGEMCPSSDGGIWNLWWNVLLTDDPESWDDDIRLVNAMQDGLDAFTLDHRLIRAQMAEFCRLNLSFPKSVDILCDEIGQGSFTAPIWMGCEGRGLLNTLGYHDAESLGEQRLDVLCQYALALDKWLAQSTPELPTDFKVAGFLGRPTRENVLFAGQLAEHIRAGDLSISLLGDLSAGESEAALGKSRPFNCRTCEGSTEGPQGPSCLCAWAMSIDAGLLRTGASSGDSAPASPAEEFRRFIEEHILAYASAINAWLGHIPPGPILSLSETRYLSEDQGLTIARRVHCALGARDEAKVWLAACLLKTIKSNQRWHDRVELMDGFPEATSWFGANG